MIFLISHTTITGYTPPSRKYLSQTAIPMRYSKMVEAMKAEMGRDAYYAVTSVGWSGAVNLNPSLYLHDLSLYKPRLEILFAES